MKFFCAMAKVIHVENPSKLPPVDKIAEIREPIDSVTIFVPDEYVGAVMTLCNQKRGVQLDLAYHGRRSPALRSSAR